MDIVRLFADFHVPIASPGQRHHRQGWVNTPCPFCTGNPGNHLGYCTDPRSEFFGRFVCHRCGGKGTLRVLARLLRVEDEGRLLAMMAKYGGAVPIRHLPPPRREKVPRTADLPPQMRCLREVPGAVRYLLGRGFNPEELGRDWDVRATGPGAVVRGKDGGGLDFSYRLIIPVYRHGKLVTYQGRDWTGKSPRKYLACPPWAEGWPIKELLYGLDGETGDEVVLMEGVTDVWRWGRGGAVACFGIKHRPAQVRELARRWDRVRVAFDPEAAAQGQARRIIRELEEWGLEVSKMRLPKGMDPGDMTREDLKSLK